MRDGVGQREVRREGRRRERGRKVKVEEGRQGKRHNVTGKEVCR